MSNVIEQLIKIVKECPAFAISGENFIKLATEHPEWTKISDFPPFSSFPAIDWDNEKILKLFLESIMRTTREEYGDYKDNAKKGYDKFYVYDLIQRFAICKFVNIAFQAKSELKDDPRFQSIELKIQYYSSMKNMN